MEKTYDRVDWEFILAILREFGFGDKVIEWIRECAKIVSFSVLVNNGPTEIFNHERGLGQGDPLSPFLFILGAEILARKLQMEANSLTRGIGFPLTRGGTRILYLSVADDVMIFTKANQETCVLPCW